VIAPHTPPQRAQVRAGRAPAWVVCLSLLLACTFVSAEDTSITRVRLNVPLSCAAWALLRSADYPEAVRVYDEGHEPRSFTEADRALLGLQWRHRQQFAEDLAARAYTALFGSPPTADQLRADRSQWVHKLMSYPKPLREAVAANCDALYELADRTRPTGGGAGLGYGAAQ
jgi:hypothetical protein